MKIKISLLLIAIIFVLSGCSSLNPDNLSGDFFVGKAIEAENKGNFQEAIDLYTEALSSELKEYDLDQIYTSVGINYRKIDNYEKAEEYYMKAVEENPKNGEALTSLGTLYVLKNEPEKSIEFYLRAIEVSPSLSTPYANVAVSYAMIGDFENADKYLKQSVVLGYDSHDVLKERIDALKELS